MNISNIIVLIVGAALAFIPVKIAGDKGYSKGGFFAYGLFFFIPALIQALMLPSRQDPTKKQFSPRALKYLITATVLLQLNIIFDMGNHINISNLRLASIVPALMKIVLFISVILGRKYIFSMVIYALYAVYEFCETIFCVVEGIKYAEKGFTRLFAFLGVEVFFSALAYALLVFVVFKYAYKADEHIESKPKILFYAPSILFLVSGIVNFIGSPYLTVYTAVMLIIVMVLYFLSFLFLGRFYYEDV